MSLFIVWLALLNIHISHQKAKESCKFPTLEKISKLGCSEPLAEMAIGHRIPIGRTLLRKKERTNQVRFDSVCFEKFILYRLRQLLNILSCILLQDILFDFKWMEWMNEWMDFKWMEWMNEWMDFKWMESE